MYIFILLSMFYIIADVFEGLQMFLHRDQMISPVHLSAENAISKRFRGLQPNTKPLTLPRILSPNRLMSEVRGQQKILSSTVSTIGLVMVTSLVVILLVLRE